MNIKDCFVGQKVGLHYDGKVLTGVIEQLDGNIATVYLSGWVLLSIHDTEDGAVSLWGRNK